MLLVIPGNPFLYPRFHLGFYLIPQINHEISQARSKSKERCLMNLDYIFSDIDFSGDTSKAILQTKLSLLISKDGSSIPPFIYVPPEWELDDNGSPKICDGQKVIKEPLRNPFFSPYILKVFQVLWYNDNARWRGLQTENITE